jgi:selenocysteine lyase/cysteine desulfurase
MEPRGLTNVVRASVAYHNSDEDLGALVDALQRLVAAEQADHV